MPRFSNAEFLEGQASGFAPSYRRFRQVYGLKIVQHQAGYHQGVRVLFFSTAEMDLLRLAAWCKDLPSKTPLLPEQPLQTLLKLGLLRHSKSLLSCRVTPPGQKVLQEAGFIYPQDKQYRGKGAILTRRLQLAELCLFFYRCGGDVFLTSPSDNAAGFLPAFALRRRAAANILGGSRLGGFYYSRSITFISYVISSENAGVYPNVEERTFTADRLLAGRRPVVLYTGSSVYQIWRDSQTAKGKNTRSFLEAARYYSCPVCCVPLSDQGIRQFRIISHPDYETLEKRMQLPKDYRLAIGCSLMEIARPAARHWVILSSQLEDLSACLAGKQVILHPVEPDNIEQLLGIRHTPATMPFQTKGGGYIHVPFI